VRPATVCPSPAVAPTGRASTHQPTNHVRAQERPRHHLYGHFNGLQESPWCPLPCRYEPATAQRSTALRVAGKPGGVSRQRGEPLHPPVDRDVVDVDTAFSQQFFDVAVGQALAQVPADRHHDHLSWEAKPRERRTIRTRDLPTRSRTHPSSLPRSPPSPNATEPYCVQPFVKYSWENTATAKRLDAMPRSMRRRRLSPMASSSSSSQTVTACLSDRRRLTVLVKTVCPSSSCRRQAGAPSSTLPGSRRCAAGPKRVGVGRNDSRGGVAWWGGVMGCWFRWPRARRRLRRR
jgi:hypothetical protein